MNKIANKNAKVVVTECKEFKGSNTFGVWENEFCYAVYSYGKHFPMYVYDAISHAWFGNYDKYSSSTSKHMSQCRPQVVDNARGIIYKNTVFLNNIIYDGIAHAVDNMPNDK
jgi:hypothetical protein